MIEYKNELKLKEGERLDDLQRNGYGIIQKEGGFCFGMDAVLLSGFVRAGRKDTVVDLGTGTGIIPLLLKAKTDAMKLYGLEIQEDMADMARRSVSLNGLGESIDIITGDIKHYREIFAGIEGGVDVVTSNPPYMKRGGGLKNPDDAKSIARHEIYCELGDVLDAAAGLLKSGGRFYMVHRPLRIVEILSELRARRIEPKRMKFVHPYIDREANMILIEAVKDARPECRIEKPLIVYKEKGIYTSEIYDIYGY